MRFVRVSLVEMMLHGEERFSGSEVDGVRCQEKD